MRGRYHGPDPVVLICFIVQLAVSMAAIVVAIIAMAKGGAT